MARSVSQKVAVSALKGSALKGSTQKGPTQKASGPTSFADLQGLFCGGQFEEGRPTGNTGLTRAGIRSIEVVDNMLIIRSSWAAEMEGGSWIPGDDPDFEANIQGITIEREPNTRGRKGAVVLESPQGLHVRMLPKGHADLIVMPPGSEILAIDDSDDQADDESIGDIDGSGS